MMALDLAFMITAFATMIVIIDPFAIGPMFLALTPGMTPRQRRLIAWRSVVIAGLLLLVFAARAQHLEQLVKPALGAGTWVICDRFTDATYAYQGGGRGLDMQAIATLETLVQGQLRPDLTLILDIDPATGLARARQRSAPDRFEQEAISFFSKVRDTYLARARRTPDTYMVVDAGQSLPDVQADIKAGLNTFIEHLQVPHEALHD